MKPLQLGSSNLEEFARTLLSLAEQDPDILVVTVDSRGSGKLTHFSEALPKQMIELGIAEQNLIGVSAGLASTGKKVFAVSPASFQTARSLEQIKNDVAYSNHPVKLIGISGGVSYGALGFTHHSLHDFAALLTFPNLDIVVPADNYETREVIKAAAHHSSPIYIRFGKKAAYQIHKNNPTFEIGKAIEVKTGEDITYIATGETVAEALMASHLLEEQGISCGVISMHTLRPFDKTSLIKAALRSKALVTVEEHCIRGGLGSLCASILMEEGIYIPFKIIGIPDEDPVSGNQTEIFSYYGLSPENLAKTGMSLLNRTRVMVSRKEEDIHAA